MNTYCCVHHVFVVGDLTFTKRYHASGESKKTTKGKLHKNINQMWIGVGENIEYDDDATLTTTETYRNVSIEPSDYNNSY